MTKSVLRPSISSSIGKPRPHGQGRRAQDPDVAGAVANERKLARREVRHDDFAGFAGGKDFAGRADDLDDDVLGRDMHSALGALVCDESGVATAVAVRDTAAECFRDLRPLVIVQPLRGHECHLDSEVVEALARGFCMARDVRERRRIAEDHSRTHRPDFRNETVELRRRHLERGEQLCAQQPIPELAKAVLGAELDRRTPDDDFRVTDVDAPPAGGTPFRRHIVADAVLAHVEDQRLAARAACVVALERARVVRTETREVGPDQRLVKTRDAREIAQRLDAGRIETSFGEQIAIVRDMRADSDQEIAQALHAVSLEFVRAPPLAAFERATADDAVVPLQTLLKGEYQAGNQARGERGSHGEQRSRLGIPNARAYTAKSFSRTCVHA